ncbi:MAG: hypothetical protein M3256_04255 [Actinomycetota bacterium]|nr:hypothetical protein [Actinomycetota bacterium]
MGIEMQPDLNQVRASEHVTMSSGDLVRELRAVIRHGLPTDQRRAGKLLPHLRSVVARSTHPDDLLSRIDALNYLLAKVIDDIADERTSQAARILFGLADGSAGTTLTVRRHRSASLLEYDFDHFRKRVEERILWSVAEALHRDLVNYRARVRRATNAYQIGRPTPTLDGPEINPEDELLSRVWQRLYEVRAETIATHLATDDATLLEHRGAGQRAAKQLQILVDDYVTTYGRQYIKNGELEYAVDGIERLVIWKVGS